MVRLEEGREGGKENKILVMRIHYDVLSSARNYKVTLTFRRNYC